MQQAITIVLPCYDPPSGWADRLIERNLELIGSMPSERFRFVIVNDGTPSPIERDTVKRIEAALIDLTWIDHAVNRGKGAALRTGIDAVDSDLYMFTDIDMPFKLESMRSVIAALLNGSNIVLGHRNEAYYEQVPFGRRLLSRSFRWMLKVLLRAPVSDTQCGLKGFDRRGREVFLQTKIDRYLFDLEFILQATRNKKLKIDVVPVQLNEEAEFKPMRSSALLKELRNLIVVLVSDRRKRG